VGGLMDTLTEQFSGAPTRRIGQKLGVEERAVGDAITVALPVLVGALSENASNEEGARSLDEALAKDHDGSILDWLPEFLSAPEAGPGDGILRHVLGQKRPAVEQGISASTGLDPDVVDRLLVALAPVVMGALGKARLDGAMDAAGLSQFLAGERQEIESAAPDEAGLVGDLLEGRGGDEAQAGEAGKGGGFLGKLLGKR
jgi:hypothetical protein